MIGWFIAPYATRSAGPGGQTVRYCQMDDFTTLIEAGGGQWSETEVLGNRCVTKVRADLVTLTMIGGTAGFRRLPKDRLDDPLSDLSNQQLNRLRDELLDAGYTQSEINARFTGNLSQHTLRDVLVFLAGRRLKPRYDAGTNTIILDGPVQNCRPVQDVDTDVAEA